MTMLRQYSVTATPEVLRYCLNHNGPSLTRVPNNNSVLLCVTVGHLHACVNKSKPKCSSDLKPDKWLDYDARVNLVTNIALPEGIE